MALIPLNSHKWLYYLNIYLILCYDNFLFNKIAIYFLRYVVHPYLEPSNCLMGRWSATPFGALAGHSHATMQ